jgi:hypothetical protein
MSMLSQKRKSKVERLVFDQLETKGVGQTDESQFSAIQCGNTIIFLTSSQLCAEFIQKNKISHQTNLQQLTFPDGLRNNPKAILGIAAGAHALNKSVEQSIEGENVLIHCNAGKERTPSTVAYYLIRYCGFQGSDAVALVKSALLERYKGDIEGSSLSLLHYYGWLRAQTPDSLNTYEQNALANAKNVQASTIEGQLPFLYEHIDNKDLGTTCFEIKEVSAFNQTLRAQKFSDKEKRQGDIPAPVLDTSRAQDVDAQLDSKLEELEKPPADPAEQGLGENSSSISPSNLTSAPSSKRAPSSATQTTHNFSQQYRESMVRIRTLQEQQPNKRQRVERPRENEQSPKK